MSAETVVNPTVLGSLSKFLSMEPKERREVYLAQRWRITPRQLISELGSGPAKVDKQQLLWLYCIGTEHSLATDIKKTVTWLEKHQEEVDAKRLALCLKVKAYAENHLKEMAAYPSLKEVCSQAKEDGNYRCPPSLTVHRLLPLLTLVKTVKARVSARSEPYPVKQVDMNEVSWKVTQSPMVGSYSYVSRVKIGERDAVMKVPRFHGPGLKAVGDLRYEAKLLRRVSGHRNVVDYEGEARFVPAGEIYECPALFMRPGLIDLHEWLSSEKVGNKMRRWSFGMVLHIAIQAAAALERCHEKGVIHGDVSLANLLVANERGKVQLIDFGLSFDKEIPANAFGIDFRKRRNNHFSPPELFHGGRQTMQGDIFRLGMCLYVLGTGHFLGQAIRDLTPHSQDIYEKFMKTNTLPPIQECHPLLRDLVTQCWASEAAVRPTATEVLHKLYHMTTVSDAKDWVQLPPGMDR